MKTTGILPLGAVALASVTLFCGAGVANAQSYVRDLNDLAAHIGALGRVDNPDWKAEIQRLQEIRTEWAGRQAQMEGYVNQLIEWASHYAESPWLWCRSFDNCVQRGERAQAAGKNAETLQYYMTAWSERYRPFRTPEPPGTARAMPLAAAAGGAYRYKFVDDFFLNLHAKAEKESLLRKIIDVARDLNPRPAPSQEALDALIEANAKSKAAHSPEEMQAVFPSYFRAIRLAPWWADAYLAVGMRAANVRACGIAREALTFYLRADPQSPYAPKARDEIANCSGW